MGRARRWHGISEAAELGEDLARGYTQASASEQLPGPTMRTVSREVRLGDLALVFRARTLVALSSRLSWESEAPPCGGLRSALVTLVSGERGGWFLAAVVALALRGATCTGNTQHVGISVVRGFRRTVAHHWCLAPWPAALARAVVTFGACEHRSSACPPVVHGCPRASKCLLCLASPADIPARRATHGDALVGCGVAHPERARACPTRCADWAILCRLHSQPQPSARVQSAQRIICRKCLDRRVHVAPNIAARVYALGQSRSAQSETCAVAETTTVKCKPARRAGDGRRQRCTVRRPYMYKHADRASPIREPCALCLRC